MSEPIHTIHPAIVELLGSIELGEPRIHNGIGLWPVFAMVRPEPVYITLVEAQPLPGFAITEVSQGGSVPKLRVVNETPHHVLLFDGEELRGAKQNRILNTTIVVPAGSSLDVPVSCTESGRWSYMSDHFSSSGSMAYAELRKRKAAAVHESLEHHACHASNQGAVWDPGKRQRGSSPRPPRLPRRRTLRRDWAATTDCASAGATARPCGWRRRSCTSPCSVDRRSGKDTTRPNRRCTAGGGGRETEKLKY